MSENLTENDKAEIWIIQCQHGYNFEQAYKVWLVEKKTIDAINRKYTPSEALERGMKVTQEDLDNEKAWAREETEESEEQEPIPEGWEWVEKNGELRLMPTEELKEKWNLAEKQDTIADKKLELLGKIEAELEESKKEDDFIRAISENEPVMNLVKSFVSALTAFSDKNFATLNEIDITIVRNGSNISVRFSMKDAQGRDIWFDEHGSILVN